MTGRVVATARRVGTPLVAAMHDLPQPRIGPADLLSLQWRHHFTGSDAIIVHGPWSRTEYRRRYPTPSAPPTVIRFGPFGYGEPTTADRALLRRQASLPDDKTTILFFGSLRRDKGLSAMLRALSLDDDGRFHLHVVGSRPAASEPAPETYQSEAAALGIASRVTWRIDYVPDADVPDIFTANDIVALPYGPSYAAFSAVLAMAIAYRRPVVATRVGDMGEAIDDFELGATAADGTPEGLSQALQRVGDDIDKFEHKLRSFASEYSWDNMADRTWELYRSLGERTQSTPGI